NLKFAYQALNYLASPSKQHLVLSRPLFNIADGDNETFFGYHDKSPESIDERYVIFHSSSMSTHKKPKGFSIQLKLYDRLSQKNKVVCDDIRAFNWQQGCRAHWLND